MASYYPKYTGSSTSIVSALNAVGVNSSYSHRKEIAAANSISNYSGSAAQNTQMLNLLKQGKLIKAGSSSAATAQADAPASSSSQSSASTQQKSSGTNSTTPLVIVKNEDGTDIYFPKCGASVLSIDNALRSIGESKWANYASRKLIAAANDISNYSGTTAQNNQMLKLLKQGNLKRPAGNPVTTTASSSSSASSKPASQSSATTTSRSNSGGQSSATQTTKSATQNNTSAPASANVPAVVSNSQTANENTNPIKKFFMNLTDKQKKALKIGAVALGVGLVGFAAYKATKKSGAASVAAGGNGKAKAALGGVSHRKKKKKSSKKHGKRRGSRRVNLV